MKTIYPVNLTVLRKAAIITLIIALGFSISIKSQDVKRGSNAYQCCKTDFDTIAKQEIIQATPPTNISDIKAEQKKIVTEIIVAPNTSVKNTIIINCKKLIIQ
jgi:hypothetical protein